jgi:hypothetical protein
MATTPRTSRKKSKPAQEPEAVPSPLLKAFQALVGEDEIIEAGRRLGVIERQRKVDLPALVTATISSLSATPGAQTSIFVSYLGLTGQKLAPSSFYDRFTEPFANLLRELAMRTITAVRESDSKDELADDLGVLLETFTDVRVADASTKLLKKFAQGWAPSTSKIRPAGVKLHSVISLRDHLPIAHIVTPQRVHDNRAFPEATMAPGTLSLFDLGYIDVERFISAIERGAHFLTRLKSTHNPTVVDVHVGKGTKRAMRGHPLDALLADGRLRADHGIIDLDVLLTSRGKEAVARVVGIEHDDGSEIHWYLTSVDRALLSGPDVAETYRLRWTIELLFKQLKSGAGLETILAWRQSAVMALIYAKVIALCLARLLELSLREDGNDEIRPRLAMMLVLTRGISLLYTWALMGRGVTLEQLEERLKMIAETVAKARNQRRERERRKREQTLGRAH